MASNQMGAISQSAGIQQLLAAEKRATEKVGEARKRKQKRLKQAKEEAQAEIEQYQKERERQYHDHEQKILGSKGDLEKKIKEQTDFFLQDMSRRIQQHQEKALRRLIDDVIDIKPEVHKNLLI